MRFDDPKDAAMIVEALRIRQYDLYHRAFHAREVADNVETEARKEKYLSLGKDYENQGNEHGRLIRAIENAN